MRLLLIADKIDATYFVSVDMTRMVRTPILDNLHFYSVSFKSASVDNLFSKPKYHQSS